MVEVNEEQKQRFIEKYGLKNPCGVRHTVYGPYFGTKPIHLQRRMPALHAMPRANSTDPPWHVQADICPSRSSAGGCPNTADVLDGLSHADLHDMPSMSKRHIFRHPMTRYC